jgi:hypothetical protein
MPKYTGTAPQPGFVAPRRLAPAEADRRAYLNALGRASRASTPQEVREAADALGAIDARMVARNNRAAGRES